MKIDHSSLHYRIWKNYTMFRCSGINYYFEYEVKNLNLCKYFRSSEHVFFGLERRVTGNIAPVSS